MTGCKWISGMSIDPASSPPGWPRSIGKNSRRTTWPRCLWRISNAFRHILENQITMEQFQIGGDMSNGVGADTGIELDLTEEMKLLQRSVRDFAEAEIKPHVMKYDEAQEFPLEIVKKMGELGFLGVTVPEELGGAGLSASEFIIIMEEISRVDPSVGLTLAAHSGLCLQHIAMFANPDQRRRFIPDLATGAKIGAWCLTEPGSGSDASGLKTSATAEGASYLGNGSQ